MPIIILILAILLAFPAPGWAWRTKKGLEQRLDTWVGRSADDFVQVWGIPASCYTYENGRKDLLFRTDRSLNYSVPSFSPGKRISVTGTVPPVGAGYMQMVSMTGYTRPTTTYSQSSLRMWCDITLRVSENNIIRFWSFKGNDCRADKPPAQTDNAVND